jgi:Cu2+-exporting ATPase
MQEITTHETVTVDAGGSSSPDSEYVARQLEKPPGVHEARVNYSSGSGDGVFRPHANSLADIEARIRECGYHCGAKMPAHLCVTEPTRGTGAPGSRRAKPPPARVDGP